MPLRSSSLATVSDCCLSESSDHFQTSTDNGGQFCGPVEGYLWHGWRRTDRQAFRLAIHRTKPTLDYYRMPTSFSVPRLQPQSISSSRYRCNPCGPCLVEGEGVCRPGCGAH